MAAMAIDEHAAHAHLPHFAEGDLDGATVNMRGGVASDRARHAAIEAGRWPESNYQSLGPRTARELLRVVVVGMLRRITPWTPVMPGCCDGATFPGNEPIWL